MLGSPQLSGSDQTYSKYEDFLDAFTGPETASFLVGVLDLGVEIPLGGG